MFTVVLPDGSRHRIDVMPDSEGYQIFSLTGICASNQRFFRNGEQVTPQAGDVVQLVRKNCERDFDAAIGSNNIAALKLLIETDCPLGNNAVWTSETAEILTSVVHPFSYKSHLALAFGISQEAMSDLSGTNLEVAARLFERSDKWASKLIFDQDLTGEMDKLTEMIEN